MSRRYNLRPIKETGSDRKYFEDHDIGLDYSSEEGDDDYIPRNVTAVAEEEFEEDEETAQQLEQELLDHGLVLLTLEEKIAEIFYVIFWWYPSRIISASYHVLANFLFNQLYDPVRNIWGVCRYDIRIWDPARRYRQDARKLIRNFFIVTFVAIVASFVFRGHNISKSTAPGFPQANKFTPVERAMLSKSMQDFEKEIREMMNALDGQLPLDIQQDIYSLWRSMYTSLHDSDKDVSYEEIFQKKFLRKQNYETREATKKEQPSPMKSTTQYDPADINNLRSTFDEHERAVRGVNKIFQLVASFDQKLLNVWKALEASELNKSKILSLYDQHANELASSLAQFKRVVEKIKRKIQIAKS